MNFRHGLILSFVGSFSLFVFMFGGGVLDPANIDWIINGDSGYHYLGWAFFRNAEWSYPLGTIPDMMYPIGTNLMQLDSIPIVGIIFRMFRYILPEHFQYFGLWTLLCFFLQAFWGYKIAYLFSKDPYVSVLGSLLAIFSPIFLYRFELMHRSLGAQWLILWLIYLNFSIRQEQRLSNSSILQLIMVNILSTGIHAYLFAGQLFLTLGLCFDRILENKNRSERMKTGLLGILIFGLTLLEGHSIGYFQVTNKMSNGFGPNSMDLLAPVNSLGKSLFFPELQHGEFQYEGFAYLGLGVMALILLALFTRLKNPQIKIPRIGYFFGFCVLAFVFFALATPITLAGEALFHIDKLYLAFQPIPSSFRASGRFVWAAIYLITFLSLAVAAGSKTKLAKGLLVIIVLLQVLDLSAWINQRSVWAPHYDWRAIDASKWEKELGTFEEIDLVPIRYQEVGCFNGVLKPGGFSQREYTSFALIAAFNKLRFNSASISRPPVDAIKATCRSFYDSLKEGSAPKNSLYIVHKDYFDDFIKLSKVKPICKVIDEISACSFQN